MEMVISFPGGKRVDAEFGGMVIQTDQPPQGGGEGSAPTPFALFLASMGTCAGSSALHRSCGSPFRIRRRRLGGRSQDL